MILGNYSHKPIPSSCGNKGPPHHFDAPKPASTVPGCSVSKWNPISPCVVQCHPSPDCGYMGLITLLICPVLSVMCLAISHLCGMKRRQLNLCKIKRKKISSNYFRAVPGTAVTHPQLQCFWILGQVHVQLWVKGTSSCCGHAYNWDGFVSDRIKFQFVSLSSWIQFVLITSLLFPVFCCCCFCSSAVHPPLSSWLQALWHQTSTVESRSLTWTV